MENEKNIIIRKATLEDVDEIYDLLADVHYSMPEEVRSWHSYTKNKERYSLFINDGYCFVACDKDKIIGAYLTYVLRDDGTEFYQMVKDYFKDATNIIEVINVVVKDGYRGLGLMNKMILKSEELLKDSKYHRFVTTVHPDNKYSLDNMVKNGFKTVITTKLYGGRDRCILVKTM